MLQFLITWLLRVILSISSLHGRAPPPLALAMAEIFTPQKSANSIKAFNSPLLPLESWLLKIHQHTNKYSPCGWEDV